MKPTTPKRCEFRIHPELLGPLTIAVDGIRYMSRSQIVNIAIEEWLQKTTHQRSLYAAQDDPKEGPLKSIILRAPETMIVELDNAVQGRARSRTGLILKILSAWLESNQ